MNLRGALDYLAGILVREAGNDPVATKPLFPILGTQECDKFGAPKPPDVKGGVSDDALKIIDAVQPYKMPGRLDHPLLFVRNLANINKHQSLPTGTKGISDVVFTDPGIQLARYAITLGEVGDDYADLIFTLIGAPGAEESGFAYILVEHAEGQQVAPIKALRNASRFIRESVVGPIERICI